MNPARDVPAPVTQSSAEPTISRESDPLSGRAEVDSHRQEGHKDQDAASLLEPEPLVLTAPRELEYVYEVGAEETCTEGGRGLVDEVDESLLDAADLVPLEEAGDEVLAFEVRSASRLESDVRHAGRASFAEVDIRKHERAHGVE